MSELYICVYMYEKQHLKNTLGNFHKFYLMYSYNISQCNFNLANKILCLYVIYYIIYISYLCMYKKKTTVLLSNLIRVGGFFDSTVLIHVKFYVITIYTNLY